MTCVEAASNYNCETCINPKFLSFLRYLSHNAIETLNTNNHSSVGNTSSIWLAKLEEEKSVLFKHSFEEKQNIFNKTNVVTSNAGRKYFSKLLVQLNSSSCLWELFVSIL